MTIENNTFEDRIEQHKGVNQEISEYGESNENSGRRKYS